MGKQARTGNTGKANENQQPISQKHGKVGLKLINTQSAIITNITVFILIGVRSKQRIHPKAQWSHGTSLVASFSVPRVHSLPLTSDFISYACQTQINPGLRSLWAPHTKINYIPVV